MGESKSLLYFSGLIDLFGVALFGALYLPIIKPLGGGPLELGYLGEVEIFSAFVWNNSYKSFHLFDMQVPFMDLCNLLLDRLWYDRSWLVFIIYIRIFMSYI